MQPVEWDEAALERLFAAVAEALDKAPEPRRLKVMTKAFVLLAYRNGDEAEARAVLAEALRDPRDDSTRARADIYHQAT